MDDRLTKINEVFSNKAKELVQCCTLEWGNGGGRILK